MHPRRTHRLTWLADLRTGPGGNLLFGEQPADGWSGTIRSDSAIADVRDGRASVE